MKKNSSDNLDGLIPDKTSKQNWVDTLSKSDDFFHYQTTGGENGYSYWISYFRTLASPDTLHKEVLRYVHGKLSLTELKAIIPIQKMVITGDADIIKQKLIAGYVAIQIHGDDQTCLLVNIADKKARSIDTPTSETSAIGPHAGFIELLDTNINLVRQRLKLSELIVKQMKVGELSKTKVAVLYIDGIADIENVNTVMQRIKDIDYGQIEDSSYIAAMIEDNSNSLFPQSIVTERPDRVSVALSEGKVVIAVDGSPNLIILPITFLEALVAMDDYSYAWIISNFFRILRFTAVIVAAVITPMYVAIMTYHYELIPARLLAPLVGSRATVPFPPILEALFLEFVSEMIKEASIRLPNKIGQSLGVVGGIVIGQAVVEAGLTSNVLLIFVGLSLLSSYTFPVYKFSNTIRFIKFPFIILASWLGLFGLFLGILYTWIHLLRLTSLGRPYLAVYPIRKTFFQDLLIRLPFSMQRYNPKNLRPEQKKKYNGSKKKADPLNDFYE